jgi:polysaccharide pyruvyl transferase WcaK-like protein
MKILVVSSDRSDARGYPSNLGDALLTDALLGALERAGHEATATDFGGPRRAGSGPRSYTRGLAGLVRAIKASDAVIVGGGTLLQDDTGRGLLNGLPRLVLSVSTTAFFLRRPMVYLGVGCDPTARWAPRAAMRLAVKGRSVWARDRSSVARVAGQLRGRARLAADVCLLPADAGVRSAVEAATHSDPARRGAVVALNRRDVTQVDATFLARMAGTGGAPPLFVAMDQRTAEGDLTDHLDGMEGFGVLHPPISWKDAAATIAGAAVVVASRMHALYLAALLGTPMIAVGRSAKVLSFAEEFRIPVADSLKDVTPGEERVADMGALELAQERVALALDDALAELEERR